MHLHEILFFFSFLTAIFFFLYIDLKVAGKDSHVLTFKEAVFWTVLWVALSLLFFGFLYFFGNLIHGVHDKSGVLSLADKYQHTLKGLVAATTDREAVAMYNHNLSLEYITGYLVEYSLSVDNVFIMILIFSAFGIERRYFRRVLFWGIIGAVVMRFIFIFLSAALIQRFHWILIVFGLFLIYTGIAMFINRNKEKKIKTQDHPIMKYFSKHFSVKTDYHGQKFWFREHKKLVFTPLFIVLVIIEFTDLVFAVDSVPAIFAVTKDPYIVFFSNIFAILGLRSLFFVVSNVMTKLDYLKEGLAVLLTFIGVKMVLTLWEIKIEANTSLLIIVGILAISILLSVLFPKKKLAVE